MFPSGAAVEVYNVYNIEKKYFNLFWIIIDIIIRI